MLLRDLILRYSIGTEKGMGYDERRMKCRVVVGIEKGMGYDERRMKCRVVVGIEMGMGYDERGMKCRVVIGRAWALIQGNEVPSCGWNSGEGHGI